MFGPFQENDHLYDIYESDRKVSSRIDRDGLSEGLWYAAMDSESNNGIFSKISRMFHGRETSERETMDIATAIVSAFDLRGYPDMLDLGEVAVLPEGIPLKVVRVRNIRPGWSEHDPNRHHQNSNGLDHSAYRIGLHDADRTQNIGWIFMFGRKNTGMRRTAEGSPIVDSPVMVNISGIDEPIVRSRPRAQVQGKNGITYMVPIDPVTGRVPEDVLYEHFLDYNNWSDTPGKKRAPSIDSRRAASTIHTPRDELGFTPEEIVGCGWWSAVNGSDLMGIDDSTSSAIRNWDDVRSSVKPHLGKIAIIAPDDMQRKVIEILQNNFTASELKRMTDKTGLIIVQGNPGMGADGCYYRRQEGVETPNIVIRSTSGEDTITHEMVHHARSTDQKRSGIARTPIPQDEDDRMIPYPSSMRSTLINLEEACTVAETTARTRNPTDNLGYYNYLKGDPRLLYEQDRRRMIVGKPLRGKRAVDKVNDTFEDTNISDLRIRNSGRKPRRTIEEGRSSGKYPPRKMVKTIESRKAGPKPKTSTQMKGGV